MQCIYFLNVSTIAYLYFLTKSKCTCEYDKLLAYVCVGNVPERLNKNENLSGDHGLLYKRR